ncbi:hypothetical protein [Mucilaginibacter rubeus]|uniref:Uncharacterized protein n=1 Tax=Mucilaginibacter rubeus TaxID=2027860 RepID=A0A5C1I159_9SPHI|nr:hypothetical protein [Mucilaginibacter rubeus]QEM11018.1 hypothetical protein DEO27_013635 [Mucilaginibacter rubeus]
MKRLLILLIFLPFGCFAQQVYQTDFRNFWIMRDSVLTLSDSAKQIDVVRRLYIDKASDGLKAFMRNKNDLDSKWLSLLKSYPAFWDSLRMKTALVDRATIKLDKYITHFKALYPDLTPAQIYFLIGIRQQGGTIRGNLSLIGVEVVLADPKLKEDELIRMAIHEYVHTQQKRPDFKKIDVLTSSIREGSCDFLSYIITGISVQSPYMKYGFKHEQEVWVAFKKDMYTNKNDNWVSTGNNPDLPAPDLGYFVGYQICKSYYDKAINKADAIKQLVGLDYAKATDVTTFLEASGYHGN